jgi:putative transposase
VEVQHGRGQVTSPEAVVGVDLGIRHLAVLADSNGEVRFEPNPRHLQQAQAALRRANRTLARRQGPVVLDPETGKKTYRAPSANWLDAKAALGKAHARVRHLREDSLPKLTTRIAGTYGTVVVEDLNVAGMLKNGNLARHLADAGFGTIRRQLSYKTVWRGGALIVADRWYPSSKTCSACTTVKAKLSLRDRVFECDACGLVIDRDENAARNLAALAAQCTTGTAEGADSEAEASKARGADRQTRSTNRTRKTTASTGAGRAGGATPRTGKEAGHRTRSDHLVAQGG